MKNNAKVILIALAFAGVQVYGANLVQNGGFENGSSGTSSDDWTFTAAASGSDFNYGAPAHSGSFAANFGSTTVGTGLDVDDTISQLLTTTVGDEYQVSYWLRTAGETADVGVTGYGQFVSSFGGQTLQNLHDPDPTFDYTEYSYDIDATSTSSLLSFSGQCVHGFFNLDDVAVTDLGAVGVPGVPDVASTFGLLGAALAGLTVLRRKLA